MPGDQKQQGIKSKPGGVASARRCVEILKLAIALDLLAYDRQAGLPELARADVDAALTEKTIRTLIQDPVYPPYDAQKELSASMAKITAARVTGSLFLIQK